MRRYNIVVSGILLIFSINNFALAAPVLVQEKHQACVDVVHKPEDVITVVEKRGKEELEKLLDQYFKGMGKPAESSDAHVSSSSAAPGPVHGSTSMVQAPPPNPASSTANPNPMMRPSGPSAAAPMQGAWNLDFGNPGYLTPIVKPVAKPIVMPVAEYLKLWNVPNLRSSWEDARPVRKRPKTAPPGFDHGSTSTNMVQAPAPNPASSTTNPNPLMRPSAPPGFDHGSTSTNVVQAPAPNPASSTANPNPLMRPSGPSAAAAPMQGDPRNPALGHFRPGHFINFQPTVMPVAKPIVMPVAEYLKMWNVPNLQSLWEDARPVRKRPKTAPPGYDHGSTSTNVVQAPAPNPASLTANPNPLMESSGPSSTAPMQGDGELKGPQPKAAGPAPQKRLKYDNQEHVQQPNPRPSTPRPSTEPEVVNPPSPNLESPKDSDLGFEDEGVVQRSPVVM